MYESCDRGGFVWWVFVVGWETSGHCVDRSWAGSVFGVVCCEEKRGVVPFFDLCYDPLGSFSTTYIGIY
jgi:hypothetical protein